MPIDILLVNAHRRYLNFEPKYGGFLGVFLLSAFLRQEGYNAKGYTGTLVKSLERIDKLCGNGNISMIGLYCDYDNVTENIKLSKHIKENYNIPVVVGGPQATALKEDFFAESKCDAIVRYEGELTLLELTNYFLEDVGEISKILGISYMDKDGLRINPNRPLIMNLDSLPFLDENCYLENNFFYRGLSVMTGRGCPFSCAFCHEGSHTKIVRLRSASNVLAEIDAYFEKNKSDQIYILFTDDTFTLKPDRVHEICKGLAERRKIRNFNWFCEGHVHTLYQHPEMITDLAMAGCTRIQLGIEAGTQKVLSSYGKHCTPEEIFKVVKLCADAGISQIYGNIILAGAHFSRETFEADKIFTEKLIRESAGALEIGAVTFWPLPETPMTLSPQNYGIKICDSEFITSTGDFPQVETDEISRLEISQMQFEMEQLVSNVMLDMLANDEVPLNRILSWFKNSDARQAGGMWYIKLASNETLYAYYEMLYLGEGKHSRQIENIKSAHPLRIHPLHRNLKLCDDGYIKINDVKFTKKDMDIIILTTGKLSVSEIIARVGRTEAEVMNVLNLLENIHFIVYTI